tara:strand:- start:94 stop:402 length:309 start_codon:yes stop_codon:yes gene_type:complete
MIDLATAILAINPSAKVIIYEEDINTIDWGETTPISNEDILAKQTELQTAYDNKKYQRDREKEYPSLIEFVEAYTEKEILADTTKWDEYVVKYNKVRTDNPK